MTKRAPKPKPTNAEVIATFRAPTERERIAMEAATKAQRKRTLPPAVKVEVKPDQASIWPVHSDGEGYGDLMRETFGTASEAFCNASIARTEVAVRPRGGEHGDQRQMNAMLALMGAIAPRNELEAVIGEQIIASHALSMELIGKAKHTDSMEKMTTYTNLATKVSRTMGGLVETLAKLRSGGKQQVVVKHVYVQGNAVVAEHAQTVISGGQGGVGDRISGQSLATDVAGLPASGLLPLRGEDQAWDALPVPSGSGQASLPDAWRDQSGRAQGEGERAVHLRPLDPRSGRSAPAGPRRRARRQGD